MTNSFAVKFEYYIIQMQSQYDGNITDGQYYLLTVMPVPWIIINECKSAGKIGDNFITDFQGQSMPMSLC